MPAPPGWGTPPPGGTPACPSSAISGWAPAPAASAPSIWAWGISSFDPPAGSQHSAPLASGVFPYPRGPPPPYFSVPPALSGDAPSPCAQVGWQTPGSSAPGLQWGAVQRRFPLEDMLNPSVRTGIQVQRLGPQTVLQPRTLPSAPFPQHRPSARTPLPLPPTRHPPGPAAASSSSNISLGITHSSA